MLTNMNVEEEYQRNGIGTEYIVAFLNSNGKFVVVNHLSTGGANFLNKCFDNGVLDSLPGRVLDNRY